MSPLGTSLHRLFSLISMCCWSIFTALRTSVYRSAKFKAFSNIGMYFHDNTTSGIPHCLDPLARNMFIVDCQERPYLSKTGNGNVFILERNGDCDSVMQFLKPTKEMSRFMSFMCSFPTGHRMDQVATQHHELWPGSELVYGLHSLLGELHLLGPFLPSAITVAVPPSLHKPQLGVCGLDEAKWSPPVALCI